MLCRDSGRTSSMFRRPHYLAWVICCASLAGGAEPHPRNVWRGLDGKLVYERSPRGDRMPDFSYAGFGRGEAIPIVPVAVALPPAVGECGHLIQAAIDEVARRPSDAAGFRGAVLLPAGRYELAGSLKLTSGVVLRGAGEATVLVATGHSRRAVIQLSGG